MNKLIVALTGGIGSGKTTVSHLFSQLGVDIIDTDIIARDLAKPNMPALKKIRNYFGKEIINEQGELKRSLLRQIIFSQPQKKLWLEELLHPLIRTEAQKKIQESKPPYCIVAIPLLFETKAYNWVDRILVIETPREMQIQRVMERDQCDREHAEKIINAQVSNEIRRQGADDIIENTGSLAQLSEKVKQLHKTYLSLVD